MEAGRGVTMDECIRKELLGTLTELPEDDPQRRHAATCPRCSALVFAYQEFVQAQPVEAADIRGAENHLARFIAAQVQVAPFEPARGSGGPRRGRGRWFDLSMFRLAAVACAGVLVAFALLRWQPWAANEIVYRGEPSAHFTGLGAAQSEGGGFELRWDTVKSADSYRVVILSQDLTEIERLAPTPELSARVDTRSDATHTPWYWQVTALLEGGEILTSDPQRLP